MLLTRYGRLVTICEKFTTARQTRLRGGKTVSRRHGAWLCLWAFVVYWWCVRVFSTSERGESAQHRTYHHHDPPVSWRSEICFCLDTFFLLVEKEEISLKEEVQETKMPLLKFHVWILSYSGGEYRSILVKAQGKEELLCR